MTPFRSPAERLPSSGHVIHGPFPARLGLIGAACVTLFMGTMMLLMGLESQRFECASGGCTIDQSRAFDVEDLTGAHTVIENGAKNTKDGVVVLELKGHREQRLMRVDPEQADEAARAIRDGVRTGLPIHVDLHGPRFLAAIGVASVVAFFVLLIIALRLMGRFDLLVSRGGRTLDIRRSVFGVPLGTRHVRLDGVERVVIEQATVSSMPVGREPLISVARLVIHARTEERPLSRGYFPGSALHLRAASALRSVLLLAPDANDDAALTAIPMRSTPMGQRIMFAWMGLTMGSVVGLAIFSIALVLLHRTNVRANIEGWVVAAGAIPGAIGGVALAFHTTRMRLPR